MIRLNRRPAEPSPVPSPAVEVAPRHLCLDGSVCTSLAVVGYPREVGQGWLQPLLTYPGRLDVSLHVEPIPPLVAADRLRRQLARLESTGRADAEHGRLADFEAEAAAEDAYELASQLARGQGRMFRAGLYLTVHAPTLGRLEIEVGRVRTLAASLLLDAKPATFRTLQGWTTTLPLGTDRLRLRRAFDTAALAASFPFTSPDLNTEIGKHPVLYGVNADSSSLVMWDRFAQDNHNSVILARSGAGKSFLAKLEALRNLYTGVEVAVIDPEDEYGRLARAVGGVCLRLGAPDVRLNPFDLPSRPEPDALIRRAVFLHTLISVLLGESMDGGTKAALDRAIMRTYRAAGITPDPRTWRRSPPLLRDLASTLAADGDATAGALADRLTPFTEGSHRILFDGHTTTRPDSHLIVFSLRDLPDELKAVGTLMTLDTVWRRVSDPRHRRPRLVVVDEAWLLMRDTEGAKFLYRMAKAARKHWAGLAVISQDAADLLGSDLGQAVVANAATQILLRQAPQAIDAIAEAFALSDGERQLLLGAERGHGLLTAGSQRVAFQAIASDAETRLATTSPEFLAGLEEDAPL
ncbi:VirB4 family type IV secretion system protein [Actinomadura rupiterrae]|uniref:VirB4 family type IV secretion system protein n=1 Tax=Actinomadura rupiterrae TaxID=559627 RepID=UPI0020A268AE|nr:ATP-binding protein [Actinomadura rupiterrae]MCP2337484.1 type IV secretory pathway VirB4 component [Actinomadura rupiterrae]